MFGDVKLTGVVRQQVDKYGDLWYKGVMHFFGSRLPIQVIIKPTQKALKGDKLYYVFTYLPAQKYQAKTKAQKHIQWNLVRARARAEILLIMVMISFLNVVFSLLLWYWYRRRRRFTAPPSRSN